MRPLIAAFLLLLAASSSRALSLVQHLDAGVLLWPRHLVVSPDGDHLYAGGGGLFLFSRSAGTGQLTPIEIAPGSRHRFGRFLLPSPDGRHVYTGGTGELGIYAVDADTGRLHLVHVMAFAGGVGFLAASPDGALVAVAEDSVYDDGDSVRLFTRNPDNGLLAPLDALGPPDVFTPYAVEFSPDGEQLLVHQRTALQVLAADPSSGLSPLQALPTSAPLFDPVDLAFSSDGASLYVADRVALRVFQRDTGTGLLTPGADDLPPSTGVVASADGAHVYACSGYLDAYARAPADGSLSFLFSDESLSSFGSPQQAAISPDGAHLYLADYDRIRVVSRDAATGALAGVQQVAGYLGGIPTLNRAHPVIVSADGRHVYVGSRGCSEVEECSFASVSLFARDDAGRLQFVEAQFLGNGWLGDSESMYDLALSPDGEQLYVTRDGDGPELVVYARDPDTGALAFLEGHEGGFGGLEGLDVPGRLVVSPDGAAVYVTGTSDDAIVVFARDSDTGALTWQTALFDGQGGIDGIATPTALAVDPAGAHLYVAGAADGAIATFQIEAGTGALTFLRKEAAEATNTASDLQVSPDGANLYAVGATGGALLTAYARDPATGALTWMSERGLPDFGGGVSVATSPDGSSVFVGRGKVHHFTRDPATGAVRFVRRVEHEAHGLAISPDGRHLYGTSQQGLSVLAPAPAAGALGATALAALAALRRYARTT